MTEQQGVEVQQPDDYFVVETEDHVAWVLGKIAAAEAALEAGRRTAKAYVEGLEAELKALHARFDDSLEVWLRTNPPKRGRSRRFVSGVLGFRKSPSRLKVESQEALLAWAREVCPESVNRIVVETVPAEVWRRHFDEVGEVAPGLALTEERDIFYVKGGKE